MNRNIW